MGLRLSGWNSYFYFEYLKYSYAINSCVWDAFLKISKVCQGRVINCANTTYNGKAFLMNAFYMSVNTQTHADMRKDSAPAPLQWASCCTDPNLNADVCISSMSVLPSSRSSVWCLCSACPPALHCCLSQLQSTWANKVFQRWTDKREEMSAVLLILPL